MPIRIQSSFQHVCIIGLISKGSRLYSVDPFCSLTQAGPVIKIKSQNIWDPENTSTHICIYFQNNRSWNTHINMHRVIAMKEFLAEGLTIPKTVNCVSQFAHGVSLHQESVVILSNIHLYWHFSDTSILLLCFLSFQYIGDHGFSQCLEFVALNKFCFFIIYSKHCAAIHLLKLACYPLPSEYQNFITLCPHYLS